MTDQAKPPAGDLDLEHLRQWIGRAEVCDDLLSPWTATAMAALLRNASQPWPAGKALPPLWHWSYFLPAARQDQLGPDGHPARRLPAAGAIAPAHVGQQPS